MSSVISESTDLQSDHMAGLLHRDPDDQVISGLAAGIANRLGVESVYVRAAFASLTLVWGVGLLLYLGMWAAVSGSPAVRVRHAEAERRQRVGLILVLMGSLLAFRAAHIWPDDGVVWPTTAIIFGAASILDRQEVDSKEALLRVFDPVGGRVRSRTLMGVVLLIIGLAMFGSIAVPSIGSTLLAVLVTGLGVTLVFGPWMIRLASDLGVERRERIRQEERAEMAAHLHDSVLQTLALIQRSDEPKRMVTLARAQERELRKWLYDRAPDAAEERLSDAMQTAADRVEADFDIPVEVVTVGDAPLDESLRALARATGEALTNAAKHAKADRISLFVETTDQRAEAFITDQGVGFDAGTIDQDRRGIADSIIGRIHRHGGEAIVFSEQGEGTEVHLTMPREVS